jgi:radical SAM superfamily enzyme YgiQ (UPF0313 family)
MNPKILFSAPCGPYPKLPVEQDPVDYFYYRNTLGQKMFQLRSFQSWHSLHLIAQNIPVESLVLENPSFRQFKKEVNTGAYAIIGIGFTILLSKKVLEMVTWVKTIHPGIVIVLGGYGTAVFKEQFDLTEKLRKLVDHICFGEGIGFFNDLISNTWGIKSNVEIRQDLLPAKNSFFRTRLTLFKQIILTGGLGCTYGCSFCATSSQFNRKYIPLFSGKQLYESLLQQIWKYPRIKSAIIYEEDFLANRAKAMEFLECLENGELKHTDLLITVFASTQSVLNFSMEELIRLKIGTIFIGVESMSDEVVKQEGLTKRRGEVDNLFKKLHNAGINTLGSLVIGWDSQDAATALADSRGFVDLNPTFYQVVPLHVVPGTRLWEKMKEEGRIAKDYQVEDDGISAFNFRLKHYSHDQAHELVFDTYRNLVKEGGPWPFRMFENLLSGYLNLHQSTDPVLRSRAEVYRSMLFSISLLAVVSRYFFYGNGFMQRWKRIMCFYKAAFPVKYYSSLLISPLLAIILLILYGSANLIYFLNPNGGQPDFIKGKYPAG